MIVPMLSSALPRIKHVSEAADFTKTVAPYLPQLYALPQQLLERINDLGALQQLYLSTNPLISCFAFAIGVVAPLVLVSAEINRNYSQVDRIWSILPALYNGHYALWAHLNGLPTQRVDYVAALSAIWGARLTFNYWRKGGYEIGSEDYRWVVVRKYAGKCMPLLDVLFISFGQCFLLFAITTPTYILLLCSRTTGNTPTGYDQFFAPFIAFLILVEFIADGQQWTFHAAKAAYNATAKVPKKYNYTRAQLDRGFNTTGLFAYSRHPNFAAEQGVWLAMYQWCCLESGSFGNWAAVGAMGYLLLFQASTWFTERLTGEKYPLYREYQQRVGKFLPKGTTESMDEMEAKKE